jgi:Family of unknown function (DUF5995)
VDDGFYQLFVSLDARLHRTGSHIPQAGRSDDVSEQEGDDISRQIPAWVHLANAVTRRITGRGRGVHLTTMKPAQPWDHVPKCIAGHSIGDFRLGGTEIASTILCHMSETSAPGNQSMNSISTIQDVIVRMEQIDSSLPATDELACFNRMYLEVTQNVESCLSQHYFSDPNFMETLDVISADLYFTAADAASGPLDGVPPAWQPLIQAPSDSRIYAIQFALAGMNAHINHDLPIAVVETCARLGTAPDQGTCHADSQKVDGLLHKAEQSVRESFESGDAVKADEHARAVLNLVANWSIGAARDVAWDTAMALWMARHVNRVESLLMGSLAPTVGMASRCLLVCP